MSAAGGGVRERLRVGRSRSGAPLSPEAAARPLLLLATAVGLAPWLPRAVPATLALAMLSCMAMGITYTGVYKMLDTRAQVVEQTTFAVGCWSAVVSLGIIGLTERRRVALFFSAVARADALLFQRLGCRYARERVFAAAQATCVALLYFVLVITDAWMLLALKGETAAKFLCDGLAYYARHAISLIVHVLFVNGVLFSARRLVALGRRLAALPSCAALSHSQMVAASAEVQRLRSAHAALYEASRQLEALFGTPMLWLTASHFVNVICSIFTSIEQGVSLFASWLVVMVLQLYVVARSVQDVTSAVEMVASRACLLLAPLPSPSHLQVSHSDYKDAFTEKKEVLRSVEKGRSAIVSALKSALFLSRAEGQKFVHSADRIGTKFSQENVQVSIVLQDDHAGFPEPNVNVCNTSGHLPAKLFPQQFSHLQMNCRTSVEKNICGDLETSEITPTAAPLAVASSVHCEEEVKARASLRGEVELLLRQLKICKLRFSAAGHFTLGMPLWYSMVGAATTYFVVLVQFQYY